MGGSGLGETWDGGELKMTLEITPSHTPTTTTTHHHHHQLTTLHNAAALRGILPMKVVGGVGREMGEATLAPDSIFWRECDLWWNIESTARHPTRGPSPPPSAVGYSRRQEAYTGGMREEKVRVLIRQWRAWDQV